jgi:NAD(P)H-dependent FMN reductase
MAAAEILMLCGSLRSGSTNLAVLRTAAEVLPAGATAQMFEGMDRLPHFNPDDDHPPLSPAVEELRAALGRADAVLISTPEYAGAMPGSFKNLLDWTIGGGEIYGKPVAWINISGPAAPSGGSDAHESLRKVLGYAGAEIVEAACTRIPVVRSDVGDEGVVGDGAIREQVAAVLARLVDHVNDSAAAA